MVLNKPMATHVLTFISQLNILTVDGLYVNNCIITCCLSLFVICLLSSLLCTVSLGTII